MKKYLLGLAAVATMSVAGAASGAIIINEIDSDSFNQPTTDHHEFIELYSTTGTITPLDGLTLALINGNGDVVYGGAVDLDGQSTDANGYYLFASNSIAGADNYTLLGAGNILQNGPDAVALYQGDATSYPNGTAATSANLVDAIVYGTDDPDDTGLLTALGETTQYNEGPNPTSDAANITLSRVPNGTGDFLQSVPTPDGPNQAIPEPASLGMLTAAGLLLGRRRRS
jgi:hypothetical protein